MKKIVQKKIVTIVQPEIAEFYCDQCEARTGTRENPKSTWHGAGKAKHYCKRACGPGEVGS